MGLEWCSGNCKILSSNIISWGMHSAHSSRSLPISEQVSRQPLSSNPRENVACLPPSQHREDSPLSTSLLILCRCDLSDWEREESLLRVRNSGNEPATSCHLVGSLEETKSKHLAGTMMIVADHVGVVVTNESILQTSTMLPSLKRHDLAF